MRADAPPDKSEEQTQRRMRRAPARVADLAAGQARFLASRQGFRMIALATRWRDVAGEALFAHSQPLSISTPKTPGKPGVLTLKVDGGAALIFQHQQREILDRVNAVLGEEAVGSIKLLQGVVERGRVAPRPAPPRLTSSQEERVRAATSGVQSPELQAKLANLMRVSLSDARR